VAQFRSATAVLATLALAGAALPVVATAQPTGRHISKVAQQRTVLMRRSVKAAGLYVVRVAITTPSARGGLITLKIGKLSRRTVIRARSPHARVRVQLAIRGGMLTIRATAQRGTPKLDVQLRRVRSLVKRSGSGAKTRASAPNSSTSLTAPVVVTPPAAPAAAPAAPTVVGSAGPPGDPASWHQVFADEFNSPTLDASKWSSGWQGGSTPVNSSELQCYDPAQIALTNGELDLNLIAKPETCGGQTRPYASAMINTEGKYNYTYGYLEARVWVSGTTAITDWPAVWTDGQSWPQDGELDIMEGLSGQACWHFHDPQGGPGGCSSATYTGGWHTYGADWEAGTVTYYYDGTPADTITTGITNSPMYIILNLAADTANSGPLQAPATMRVDYIHLWQH
jgi:beta-glucanase (GH16 family)